MKYPIETITFKYPQRDLRPVRNTYVLYLFPSKVKEFHIIYKRPFNFTEPKEKLEPWRKKRKKNTKSKYRKESNYPSLN